jgi:putative aldouronate transport system permease protein
VQETATLINKKQGKVHRYFSNVWRYRQLMLMLLPTLAYFIVFRYGPITGIVIAFQDFIPRVGRGFFQSILESEWVGFDNFTRFIHSMNGVQIVINTILISLYKIIFGFPAPIILAILLNEIRNDKFKKVTQTICYLPHFISWVILAGIIRIMISPDYGILIPVFKALNMDVINFLGEPALFRSLLVTTDIYQSIGWGSIIYLAAISGIDHELYEAAAIDGAGKMKKLLYITLPSISSTIVVMFILRIGKILSAGFDQVFNLYNPAVYQVADIIDTYIYRVGLVQAQFSYTAAIGFFQALIGFSLVLTTNFIAKRTGQEGIW